MIYSLALHLFTLAMLPKTLWEMITKKKYRQSFFKKLGFGFPKINNQNRPIIWIHAVSVGETKAMAPLAKKFKENHPNSYLLISSGTETGHTTAKNELPFADAHTYLPLDLPYIINPLIKKIRPTLLLLTETDFWLNFQKSAKKYGAQIVVINGKISERSTSRFKKLPFFSRPLFKTIDHFCLQGVTYRSRFVSLGIPPSKILVTGNLKITPPPPQTDRTTWQQKLGIPKDTLVLTCGSTHPMEEETLLDLVAPIPNLKILLVPRHPDRFDQVATLLDQKRISYSRYSQNPSSQTRVTLVDTMGILNTCYWLSDLAFVGGTLSKKNGGHNLIEPSFYGVPVVYGPHTHAQPDLLNLLQTYNAGAPLSKLLFLISSPTKRATIGKNGLKLTQECASALSKTYSVISPLLEKNLSDRFCALSRDGAVVSSLGS